MSRQINGINHISSEHELNKANKETSRMICLRKMDSKMRPVLLFLLFSGRTLWHIGIDRTFFQAEGESGLFSIGDILIGRIMHFTADKKAAFVRIAEQSSQMGFLEDPAASDKSVCLTNRTYDGKLYEGDEIIVQISQEAQKNKPCSLTAEIDIPGQYIVLSSSFHGFHYSSRLSTAEKKSLEDTFSGLLHENGGNNGYGILFRSAARASCKKETESEFERLSAQMDGIFQNGIHKTCCSVLKRDQGTFLRYLSHIESDSVGEVISDSQEFMSRWQEYSETEEFHYLNQFSVRFYQNTDVTLENVYAVNSAVSGAKSRLVWLPCGGSIIIDTTEAMTVIDVNSAKNEASRKSDQNALKVNKEAAFECMHQIMLRNYSGMILIDFINLSGADEKELIACLQECIQMDSGRTHFIDMTRLGIAELTRTKKDRVLSEELLDISL